MGLAQSVKLVVDYGTSHTVAVWQSEWSAPRPLLFDGTPLLPSAVLAGPGGRLVVGVDAVRGARLSPAAFEPHPKRRIDELEILLGERAYPIVELVGAALARVAAEAVRVAGPVGELVMTCPVSWGPARRAVLSQAAVGAGLPAPAFVTEPVAAATYFAGLHAAPIPSGSCLVVYDLGGGTLDVCVVRNGAAGFEPLAYRGLDDFGGVDLDALIVSIIGGTVGAGAPEAWRRLTESMQDADRRHRQALWDDARHVKEALSRQPQASLYVPVVEHETHVTREELEQAARPALERTVAVMQATLREARVAPGEAAGLFLVGGATRMPLVATLLQQGTGLVPTVLEQPETVVAEGALRATAPASQAETMAPPAQVFAPPTPAGTPATAPHGVPFEAAAPPPASGNPPTFAHPGAREVPVAPPVSVQRWPALGANALLALLGPAVAALAGALALTGLAGSAGTGLQRDLGYSARQLTAILVMAFVVATLAAALFGWIGRYATRTWIMVSCVILLVAFVVAALAENAALLTVGCVLCGLGTGILLGQLWIVTARLRTRPGRLRGMIAAMVAFPALLGPVLSGAVTSALTWRWSFLLLFPPALVALIISAVGALVTGRTAVPGPSSAARQRLRPGQSHVP